MEVQISESTVRGTAKAPPSKSYTHRAILAAGYARGATVENPLDSADIRATCRSVEAFGGTVTATDNAFVVDGFDGHPQVPDDVIDCGNSGTTTRLVTGAAALADGTTVLTGDDSLRTRPQGPLLDAIEQLGGRGESTRGNGQAPLVVTGPISGGEVSIPGDVSSQYISSLLMAGAVTDEGIDITLETELKSAPYVEITRELLADFGVDTERTARGFAVPGGQSYDIDGGEYDVPGDFSAIAFLLAAGAVAADEANELVVEGAYPGAQGDTAIVDVLERMDAAVDWNRERGEITVTQSDLEGVTVDVGDTPDLLPPIATLGAIADGTTVIENCEHVRYKETDRVSAMAEELAKMGVHVEEAPETLTIHGGESDLVGAHVDGRADHRIVMAMAVAGLVADGTTTIAGGEHVDVSFPSFFDVLYDLGADVSR
jgi:3-phosphoshikimate 1-carboxyvinyltransferase